MSEQTFLSAPQIAERWGRHRTFVYAEVKAGRLAPPDRGRWPLAEVRRYEREVGIPAVIEEQRVPQSAKKTCLYRHFDVDGKLLYVGISLSAVQRLSQHRAKAHWSRLIASITVEWFGSRHEAEAAEIRAIRSESPLHNVAGRL